MSRSSEIEMRGSRRARTLKAGKILLEGGGVIDCIVRDLSPDGARLRVPTPTPLPRSFRLSVGGAAPGAARLKWQRGAEAGVVLG